MNRVYLLEKDDSETPEEVEEMRVLSESLSSKIYNRLKFQAPTSEDDARAIILGVVNTYMEDPESKYNVRIDSMSDDLVTRGSIKLDISKRRLN